MKLAGRLAPWGLLGLVVVLLSSISANSVDLDLFHEMALAREIMQRGSVPWHDSFAYTPVQKVVVHHEWGAGMVAYGLTNAFGAAGIVGLKFVLIFALAAVCFLTARRRRDDRLAIGLCALGGIFIAHTGFAAVRAQMYTYVFVALLFFAFEVDRKAEPGWWSRHWVIVFAALFPLWVNLHGGSVIGAAFLAAHGLEQVIRRRPFRHLALAGLALLPLATLNPWGWHYLAYSWRALTLPRPAILEWAPIWHRSNVGQVPLFLGALAIIAVSVKGKRFAELGGIVPLAVAAVIAARSARFLPFFGIAFASYVPAWLATSPLGALFHRSWRNLAPAWGALLSITAVALGLRAFSQEPWRLVVPSHRTGVYALVYPVGAVDYLERHRDGSGLKNVFVPYDYGSYLMWRLGPRTKISMDSRYEVAYPPYRLNEDLVFYKAQPGWGDVLAKYPSDVVLVPQWFKVTEAMRSLPAWPEVYADADFAIFARADLHLPVSRSSAGARAGNFPEG